jgi:hypothetical protein
VSQNEIFILIIGIVASISMILSSIAIRRPRLLLFSLITSALCVIQYGMTGAIIGMAICIVGVLRNSVLLLGTKYPKLNHWSILVVFLLASIGAFALLNDWNNPSIIEALPVIGAVTGTIAVFFLDVRYTKIGLIITGSIWLVYEFHNHLYGQMLGEILTIIGNAIALGVLISADKRGIKEEDIETIEEQIGKAITTSIPVITGRIQVIQDTLTRPIAIIKTDK